jgi:hypothetical protein
MREIKFRAWDKINKKIYQVASFDNRIVRYQIKDKVWTGMQVFKRECVLMEYAGIQDLKGNEIYEGDILASPNNSIEIRYLPKYLKVVKWTKAGFNLKSNNFEIVGNIYENPGLLKG